MPAVTLTLRYWYAVCVMPPVEVVASRIISYKDPTAAPLGTCTVTVFPEMDAHVPETIEDDVPEEVLVPCLRMVVVTDRSLGYVGV